MKCPFCSCDYDEKAAARSCGGCSSAGSCGMIMCPRCGYETPATPPTPAWVSRLAKFFGGALFICIALAPRADAKLFLTQKDAMALAFPRAALEKKTVYLAEEDIRSVEARARAKLDSGIWTYYVARSTGGAILGYAYFDRVIVRTLPAVLMGVIGPDGRLRSIDILTFAEPEDYLPRRRWLGQFVGRALDDDLRPNYGIDGVSGATLTAHSFTAAARRLLAVHAVIHQASPETSP